MKIIAIALAVLISCTEAAPLKLADVLNGKTPVKPGDVVELPTRSTETEHLYTFLAASRTPKPSTEMAEYLVKMLDLHTPTPKGKDQFETRKLEQAKKAALPAQALKMLVNAYTVKDVVFLTKGKGGFREYDFDKGAFRLNQSPQAIPSIHPVTRYGKSHLKRQHGLFLSTFVFTKDRADRLMHFTGLKIEESKAQAVPKLFPKNNTYVRYRIYASIAAGNVFESHPDWSDSKADFLYFSFKQAEVLTEEGKVLPGTPVEKLGGWKYRFKGLGAQAAQMAKGANDKERATAEFKPYFMTRGGAIDRKLDANTKAILKTHKEKLALYDEGLARQNSIIETASKLPDPKKRNKYTSEARQEISKLKKGRAETEAAIQKLLNSKK